MPEHLLFATDFSPTAAAAFKQLRELAVALKPRISLLHVYEITGSWLNEAYQLVDPEFFGLIETDLQEQALERLEVLRQDLLSSKLRVESFCRRGHAGRQISEFAREEACDLIVLGHRGQRGAASLLLGSTSRYVLHHAPCPVLVIPGRPHTPAILY